MKKILGFALVASLATACNNSSETTVNGDSTMRDSAMMDSTYPTMDSMSTSSVNNAYAPMDGDAKYTGGKLMVYRNNNWVAADADVKLDDGTVIYKDGKVKKENNEVVLSDGEVVTRSGNFFDKAGNAISDGWDATKHGASEAGQGIKKGAEKAAEGVKKGAGEVKDVFTGKDEH